MTNVLLDALVFDVCGSLLNRQIPTCLRATPAYWEGAVNSSWKQVAFGSHHPRFSSEGILTLEKETTNLVTHPRDLTHSSWVKGSSFTIYPDSVNGPDSTYRCDRIVVNATSGNTAAQTIAKAIPLYPANGYVATVCMALADGQFGAGDYIEISGDVQSSPRRVSLAGIYNNKKGNFIPIYIPLTTAGTAPNTANGYSTQTMQSVSLKMYVTRTVSIDWAYAQVEPGLIPTTFVDQAASIQSRDKDFVQYATSPIAKLNSFVFYCNLYAWKGNGNILDAGNFKVDIVNGKLQATCDSTICTAPDPLPDSAKIAIRVSQGLGKIRLYINGIFVADQTLPPFEATASTITLGADGMRQIRCMYLFNQDLSDGSAVLGAPVTSDLYTLHYRDALMPELVEGYGMITLPPIVVPASSSAMVRFLPIPHARQTISSIATSNTKVAQVDRVTVQTVVSASAAQTDWILIDDERYTITSDATPTTAEIAAAFAAAINQTPKRKPVTAAYTTGDSFFTVTADVAGENFDLVPSSNLSRVTTTENAVDTNVYTVQAAVDFSLGVVQIFRNYVFVGDAHITQINTGTNQLTTKTYPNSISKLIKAGDIIIQPRWQLQLGRNSYFVHHLEDYPDIKVTAKGLRDFAYKNVGKTDRIITPYFKVAL